MIRFTDDIVLIAEGENDFQTAFIEMRIAIQSTK